MTTVDEFFSTPAESEFQHPRLRNWKSLLAEGAEATLEVYRPETDVGQLQSEMHLHFTKNGKSQPLETVLWDDDLNAGLIQLKVPAISPKQEAERFALGLRTAFRKTVREFGDGYFNAVLMELLKDSGFAEDKEIAEVLKHAYANRPHKAGTPLDRYTICYDLISNAIKARLPELTGLGYSPEEAKRILVSALARYLDERFTVSSRRRLGLL